MSVRHRVTRLAGHWRGFPAEARRAYRAGGLSELRQLVAERSVHLVFHRDRMVVIAQPLDAVREVAMPAGVTITTATPPDLGLLSEMSSARDIELFRTRLAAGRTCLLAWRKGQPITVCPLPLPAHAAYLYDLYVIPSERSSGVGSALVSARLTLAHERGFTEGWRMISVGNAASLRTAEKTGGKGTRVVGEMAYVKLLDRVYPRFTPRVEEAYG
jgi:GNAT superfamily N-acetyltransferase